MNYYNEWDYRKAAWLRELIHQGHIPPGDVDERSITEIQPSELTGYTQCHFFAGVGAWSHALRLANWPVTSQVWTMSLPCQSFSIAGKGTGFADHRHLWPQGERLIRQCRPSVVFGEQSPNAINHGWMDLVSIDLEREDYAVGSVVFPACSVGAPHRRQRLYWVADDIKKKLEKRNPNHGGVENSQCTQRRPPQFRVRPKQAQKRQESTDQLRIGSKISSYWAGSDWVLIQPQRMGESPSLRPVESGTFPLANGAPSRVGRLRGYGDAIVAPQAAEFIIAFMKTTESRDTT